MIICLFPSGEHLLYIIFVNTCPPFGATARDSEGQDTSRSTSSLSMGSPRKGHSPVSVGGASHFEEYPRVLPVGGRPRSPPPSGLLRRRRLGPEASASNFKSFSLTSEEAK